MSLLEIGCGGCALPGCCGTVCRLLGQLVVLKSYAEVHIGLQPPCVLVNALCCTSKSAVGQQSHHRVEVHAIAGCAGHTLSQQQTRQVHSLHVLAVGGRLRLHQSKS